MLRCTQADRKNILAYIDAEPEINLFIYGDVETVGVDTPPVQVWANPGREGWDCLILQYFDSYILYSQNPKYDAAAAAEFLRGRKVQGISGKKDLMERLAPYFPGKSCKLTYMSRCNAVDPVFAGQVPSGITVRELGPEDLDQTLDLLRGIEEFADSYHGEDREREELAQCWKCGGMMIGAFKDGRLVSTAQTTAASSRSAMVVGVATRPEERGHGYASAVVAELCRRSFAQGREFLCLFYDNPAAGRIYHRIGFSEVGGWTMLN